MYVDSVYDFEHQEELISRRLKNIRLVNTRLKNAPPRIKKINKKK